MGVFNYIGDRIATKAAENILRRDIQLAYGALEPWRNYLFRDLATQGHVEEGYVKNAAVFDCISKLILAYADAPLLVYRQGAGRKGSLEALAPDHPLQQRLDSPNDEMDLSELRAETMFYMAVGEAAYWHKLRSRDGRFQGVMPYSSVYITPVSSPTRRIDHYQYDNLNGTQQEIPFEDMIRFKWPSFSSVEKPWRGLPPLVAIAREYMTDNEMTRYAWALMKNDATPKTILVDGKGILQTDKQRKELKASYEDGYSGDNRGKTAVMPPGVMVQRVSLDIQELAFDALRRVPETRIASAFMIPPVYAGLSVSMEAMTYDNQQGARKFFYEDVMMQFWKREASILTRFLVPENVDRKVYIWFDTQDVSALQEDRTAKVNRVHTLLTDGVISKAEARSELGYDALEEQVPANELRSTVGGAGGFVQLVKDYEAGLISRSAALALSKTLYGFDEPTAAEFFDEQIEADRKHREEIAAFDRELEQPAAGSTTGDTEALAPTPAPADDLAKRMNGVVHNGALP